MQLSETLYARALAIETQPEYRGESLAAKTIIAIEAPFGVGKSTVSDKCIAMLQASGISAGIIGTETTREHRANDPKTYTTEVDPEALIKKGEAGQLINLTPFATGHLYATSAQSIPYAVNIGPMLPAALQKFKDAGCGAVHAFYLTTSPEQWQNQLQLDNRLARPDAAQRIEEAQKSLAHAYQTADSLTFINNDGNQTVEQLAGLLLFRAGFHEFATYAASTPSFLHDMATFAATLTPQEPR